MESGSINNTENIYFRCRKEAAKRNDALYSREKASELLGCSVSTLANYELGVTKSVPPDAVVMMADLYNAPDLLLHYCSNECPIGNNLPIPTGGGGVERAAIKVLKFIEKGTAEIASGKLLKVASDGELTKENKEDIEWLVDYAEEFIKNLGELRLSCHKLLSDNET